MASCTVDQVKETLCKAAEDAGLNAYAPYSKFRVGAAVLADGKVYTGANVENASFPLTLCAERAALSAAVAAGTSAIEAIAIACIDADREQGLDQLMPCGACRQWIVELAPDARIFICGADREYSAEELLPMPFKLQ